MMTDETPASNPDTLEPSEQGNQLLQEETPDSGSRDPSAESQASVSTANDDVDGDLSDQVMAMLAEAEREDGEEPAAETGPESTPADDPTTPTASAAAAPKAPLHNADDVLEDSLADLTSQLLNEDLTLPIETKAAPIPAAGRADAADSGFAAETRSFAHEKSSAQGTDEVTPAADGSTSGKRELKIHEIEQTIGERLQAGAAIVSKGAAIAARKAGAVALPIGAAGVLTVNKPLESRSETIRQTVGWLALYTLFLAACVWVYVLLIRTPETPTAETVPNALTTQDAGLNGPAQSSGSSEFASVDLQD